MHRLPARAFYGIILTGFVLGIVLAAGSAWAYRAFGGRHPEGRGVYDGIADDLVLPVAVMAGATFGGLAGFAAAVWASRASHGTGSGNDQKPVP
jgi:hypothetical protein